MSLPPFELIVDEHGAAVLRVCRALLSPADAEEAWSETFLAALRAYPRLRSGSNVRAWLLAIARNKGIDVLRARARAPLAAEATAHLDGIATGTEHDPADFDGVLLPALAALPEKQRAAIAYHYLADLRYAEVGELIGSSEAAARRSAADGLAALRRSLRREDL
ncbi:MAG: RNA polymerase sigma factor [Solirubrobacteraceae bacterium]